MSGVVCATLIVSGCSSSKSRSASSTSVLGSGASSSSAPTKTASITIGVEDGLTGATSAVGVPQVNGIKLAASEINNAGGFVVGDTKYTLNLETEDDTSTPTVGVEVVQKLLGNNVHFMLGMLSSDVVSAYQSIIGNNSNILAIASGVALPSVTTFNNVFRIASPTTQDTAADLNYVKQQGWKTIAIFTDNTHAGYMQENKLEDSLFPQEGVTIVSNEYFPLGTTQFGAQLSQTLPKHPDVIDIRGYATDALRIIQQARSLGYTGPFITTSGPTAAEVTKENVEAAMNNVFSLQTAGVDEVATSPPGTFPSYAQTTAQSLAKNYKAMFNTDLGLLSGNSYATVYALVQAMKDAGTTTDLSAIEKALTNMKVSEVQDHLPFPITAGSGGLLFQKHDALQPVYVSKFTPLTSAGQFVTISPVTATYPGVTS